jgi:hypothetical protein
MLLFFTYFFSQPKKTKPFLHDVMYGITYGIMFTGILNPIFFLNAFRKKSLFC